MQHSKKAVDHLRDFVCHATLFRSIKKLQKKLFLGSKMCFIMVCERVTSTKQTSAAIHQTIPPTAEKLNHPDGILHRPTEDSLLSTRQFGNHNILNATSKMDVT